MMKTLKLKLERLLPFLAVPRLEGPRDTPGVMTGAVPAEALQPDGSYSHLELRNAELKHRPLPRLRLYRAALDNTRFDRVDLQGARITHSRLKDCRFENSCLEAAHWSIVDAEGASLADCDLRNVHWTGVSLRDGSLEKVDLSGADLTLSDLFGSRLKQVNAARANFTGVDLSFASLEEVDLSGADLRGCTLAYALFQNVKLEDALVADTDLRGVRGLSREARADLRRRGAVLRTGWIERLIGTLLERSRPQTPPEQIDALSRRVSLAVKLGGLALVVAVTVHLFWSDALAPQRHGGGDAPSGNTGAIRTPTDEEVTKTKENLARLKAAIQDAYTTSGKYGVARYPSIEDLANNQFDRDGFGPADEKLPLIPGGIPSNFLTAGEGVVPYCNDPATQETLTGDDADWHYCDATGRIYACGGFTDAPTLNW